MFVAPFAGAWIEICISHGSRNQPYVAPFAGAWIEISSALSSSFCVSSLPSRERGLKSSKDDLLRQDRSRSLRGSVD